MVPRNKTWWLLLTELLGDLLEQKPSEKSFYEHVIIVDNIPQVKSEKVEKLKNVLMKTFKTYGDVVDTFYPQKEDGTTKGLVCFSSILNALSLPMLKFIIFIFQLRFCGVQKSTTSHGSSSRTAEFQTRFETYLFDQQVDWHRRVLFWWRWCSNPGKTRVQITGIVIWSRFLKPDFVMY